MKQTIVSVIIMLATASVFGQKTAETHIADAQAKLKANNYKDAVASLQLAIQKINETMVSRVVAVLPTEINGFKANTANESEDEEGTAVVAGGMNVSRTYTKASEQTEKSGGFASLNKPYFSIVVAGNSMIVSAVNMALNNPALQNAQGMELQTIGTRKGVFQKKEDDDKSFVFQMPLTASLIAVNGFNISETEFRAIVSKINYDAIAKSLCE